MSDRLRTHVPLSAAADDLRDGDLLLFRRRGLISIAGRGVHSHAAKIAWWGETPFCVEVREWYGGRAVTLASQVERCPSRIDVFAVNPDSKWPEYDAEASTRFMRSLAGFAIDPAVGPPEPGDRIEVAGGGTAQLTEVRELRAGTDWLCESQAVTLAADYAIVCQVDRAQWQETVDGPTIVGWTAIASGLEAVVRPASMSVDDVAEGTVASLHELYLVDPIDWRVHDRVTLPSGDEYSVLAVGQPETIGGEWTILARRVH